MTESTHVEGIESALVGNGHQRDKVMLVIAAFNEGSVIHDVVKGARNMFPNIVVVDDGSRDLTAVNALSAGATVLVHPINLGQGAALQTGIEYAVRRGVDYIATFDADGQHDVMDVCEMVRILEGSGVQVALGSRFIAHADAVPLARRALLRAATVFTRLTTGLKVTDAHNGLRVLRLDAAARIRLRQNRMAHASEILEQIGGLGLSYVEAPVHIRYTEYSRAKGQSGFGAVNILIDLLMARLRK